MLVKLTDTKGQDYWINPLYVRGLIQRKRDLTEVHIVLNASPWSGINSIKVPMPADELAGVISAAMPDAADYLAAAEAEGDQERQAAAQRAVILGG